MKLPRLLVALTCVALFAGPARARRGPNPAGAQGNPTEASGAGAQGNPTEANGAGGGRASGSGGGGAEQAGGPGGACGSPGGYSRLTAPTLGDYFGAGKQTMDPTRFDSVFSNPRFPDARYDWPGISGALVRFDVPTNNYVSLKFTVTAQALAARSQNGSPKWGRYMMGEDGIRPAMSMTVSAQPGDFGQCGTVLPDCSANTVHADGGLIWTTAPVPPPAPPSCLITQPGVYYLNMIEANISAVANGGAPVSTVPGCLKLMGSKASRYPGICQTMEILNWGNFVTSAEGSSGGSGLSADGSGGSGAPRVPNALICSGGLLMSGHVDFFSPMPPSCSSQGFSAGQACSGAQACPLP